MIWSGFTAVVVLISSLNSKQLSLFMFFILMLLMSLRFYVGSDFDNYVVLFESDGDELIVERSFYYISDFLKSLGFNYQSLFALYSFLTFGLFYLGWLFGTWRYTFPAFVLLFYIFLFYPLMSLVRQGLCLAIIYFAFSIFILRGTSYVRYYFAVVVSFFVHSSAVFSFILPILYRLKFNNSTCLLLLVVTSLFVFSGGMELSRSLFLALGVFDYKGHLSKSPAAIQSIYLLNTFLLMLLFFLVLSLRRKLGGGKVINFSFNCFLLLIIIRLLSIDLMILNRFSFFLYVFMFPIFYRVFMLCGLHFRLIFIGLLFFLLVLVDVIREGKDEFYSHVSINLCLLNDPCPVTVLSERKDFEDFVL